MLLLHLLTRIQSSGKISRFTSKLCFRVPDPQSVIVQRLRTAAAAHSLLQPDVQNKKKGLFSSFIYIYTNTHIYKSNKDVCSRDPSPYTHTHHTTPVCRGEKYFHYTQSSDFTVGRTFQRSVSFHRHDLASRQTWRLLLIIVKTTSPVQSEIFVVKLFAVGHLTRCSWEVGDLWRSEAAQIQKLCPLSRTSVT